MGTNQHTTYSIGSEFTGFSDSQVLCWRSYTVVSGVGSMGDRKISLHGSSEYDERLLRMVCPRNISLPRRACTARRSFKLPVGWRGARKYGNSKSVGRPVAI